MNNIDRGASWKNRMHQGEPSTATAITNTADSIKSLGSDVAAAGVTHWEAASGLHDSCLNS